MPRLSHHHPAIRAILLDPLTCDQPYRVIGRFIGCHFSIVRMVHKKMVAAGEIPPRAPYHEKQLARKDDTHDRVRRRAAKARRRAKQKALSAPDDAKAKAKAMLMDPAFKMKTMQWIASQCGLKYEVVRGVNRRLTAAGAVAFRNQENRAASLRTAEEIRDAINSNPDLTLKEIGGKLGMSYAPIQKRYQALVREGLVAIRMAGGRGRKRRVPNGIS